MVPGLDHPVLQAVNKLAAETLATVDQALGWNDANAPRPSNDVAAARQKVRGALTEAVLHAFAAVQHRENTNDHR